MKYVLLAFAALGTVSQADVFEDYEGFREGTLGESFASKGVAYHDANNVSGRFPDGVPFGPDELGNDFIIEQADVWYDEFPAFGSPVNTLTFGRAFITGPNLSLGPLASIWMSLDDPAQSASLDLGYLENGPWGGIEYRLDAVQDDVVVATDSFFISDLGGRDNGAFQTLSVAAGEFDQLHLYAMLNGEFTAPRGIIDDLSITNVPTPATAALLLGGMGLARRRRG